MYVELGYPIYAGMPVYPGLPEVEIKSRESIRKGDDWNGSVLNIYLHAGTHADAPWHFVDSAAGIDSVSIEKFIYENPMIIYTEWAPNYLISIEDLKAAGDELYYADALFFVTGHWKFREKDFDTYKDNFPALSPEAAEYIRTKLLNVKAVAIDTLSIENLKEGKKNGYRTHNLLLNPKESAERTLVIIEDYNPKELIEKKILSAVAVPLRIKGKDATPINIIANVE